MAAKARISTTYRWRLGLIAAMCLGWGVMSLYDGFKGYPEHNKRVELFRQIKDKSDYWREEWDSTARANGWSIEDPGTEHSRTDIYAQFVMAALTMPIGLFFGFSLLTSFKRWIATDEQGVSTNCGKRALFSAITTLNKERWKTKGIAVIKYQDGASERRIVLDDWKYEQAPIETMLREVESHLRREQIVGGAPIETAPPAEVPPNP